MKTDNIYNRPVVARLVRDGIFGLNGAWSRRWPRPMTGRPGLVVIIGWRS
jgi:hypothetical protein